MTNKAFTLIEGAKNPDSIFNEDAVGNRMLYLQLSKILHPDANSDDMKERATTAFAKLQRLYTETLGPIAKSTWVLNTKKNSYVATSKAFIKGDIANLYEVAWMDGEEERGVLKMPRNPRHSNMVQQEANMLRRLQLEGEEKFKHYAPVACDLFRHKDNATKATRACLVMEGLDGFYSLAEVMTENPNGISGRDAAWMWRRLLVGLGFAHKVGIVHGAVWPEHVMIHPEMHGLVLVGWGQSTEIGGKISATVSQYKNDGPQEMIKGEPVNEATDIHMAASTMMAVLGKQAPKAMRAFAKGCQLEKNSMRPHDAWELKEEYDDLLLRMYGKRKFVPFSMPTEALLNEVDRKA